MLYLFFPFTLSMYVHFPEYGTDTPQNTEFTPASCKFLNTSCHFLFSDASVTLCCLSVGSNHIVLCSVLISLVSTVLSLELSLDSLNSAKTYACLRVVHNFR